jgi:hypothetical protein
MSMNWIKDAEHVSHFGMPTIARAPNPALVHISAQNAKAIIWLWIHYYRVILAASSYTAVGVQSNLTAGKTFLLAVELERRLVPEAAIHHAFTYRARSCQKILHSEVYQWLQTTRNPPDEKTAAHLLSDVRENITDKAYSPSDAVNAPYLLFAPEDDVVKKPFWFPIVECLPYEVEVTEAKDVLINNLPPPFELMNAYMDVGCFMSTHHLTKTMILFAHDPWGHLMNPPASVASGNCKCSESE